jgi:hypothetical protein
MSWLGFLFTDAEKLFSRKASIQNILFLKVISSFSSYSVLIRGQKERRNVGKGANV